MTIYLRFGEIPDDEKSINYLKLSFRQMEILNYGEYPESAKEIGVSVFEIDKNRMPILNNLQLCSSLASRLGAKAYIVTGDIIGTGNDGEPLLKNVQVISKRRIKREILVRHILKTLINNFEVCRKTDTNSPDDSNVYQFFIDEKVNIVTGKFKHRLEDVDNLDEWVIVPKHELVVYYGWEFKSPISSFDTKLGCKK